MTVSPEVNPLRTPLTQSHQLEYDIQTPSWWKVPIWVWECSALKFVLKPKPTL